MSVASPHNFIDPPCVTSVESNRAKMGIWYCTIEDVANALDLQESARVVAQLGRAIESSSRAIDGAMARTFWPELDTRYFDWPGTQGTPAYRLWLDDNELISATVVTAGGVTLDPSTYQLEPNRSGPPFGRLELRRDGTGAFSGGTTPQRAIGIAGLFGYRDDSMSVGTSVGAMTDSTTAVVCTNPVDIGIGSLIKIDSERMIVTAKGWRTMSQTLQTPIDAQKRTVAVAVTTGSAFVAGESILLDSERMRVVDIAGNTLTVERAVDGSVLAAHTGSTIYSPRALVVTRAAAGTTAATHADAAPVTVWLPPGGIRSLVIAEAMWLRQGDAAGWTGSTGSGDSARTIKLDQLEALRKTTFIQYGRKLRHRAV
jgi:hypothetical protein